jgi:hypothetical protein
MDENTEGLLCVIRKVIAVTHAADISAWLFGGLKLSATTSIDTRQSPGPQSDVATD